MLRNSTSTTVASTSLEQSFRNAEASLRLEGLDPTTSPHYVSIRAQVIAGTMSFDEAQAAMQAHYTARAVEETTATA